MTWRRALIGVIGLVLLILIAGVGALLWVVRTDSGTRWLVREVVARTGSVLAVGDVSGTLLDGIAVTDVRVVVGGTRLDIDALRVSASLSELIARRLVVYELAAGAVRLVQESAGATSASGPGMDLDLPVSVELRRVSVESLTITTPDTQLVLGGTSFAADLDDSGLGLRNVLTSTRGVNIDGEARLELGSQPSLVSEFHWSTEIDGLTWSGGGSTTGWFPDLEFKHELDAPFRLAADGDLELGDEPQAHVQIEWQDLDWPGFELARSPSGSAQLEGWIDGFDFSGSGQAVVMDTSFAFTTTGSATPQTIAIAGLSIESDAGNADVSGSLALDSMSASLTVDARGIDPGRLIEAWPGNLSASGQVQVSFAPELRWTVSDLNVAGMLRDRSVAASGEVASSRTGEWQLNGIELDWGGNHATVSGIAGTALDLKVSVDAPRLDALQPGVGGRLTLDGRLSGSMASPAFVGAATVDNLAAGNFAAERLHLDGSVSAAQEAGLALRFEANGIRAREPIVESIAGRIDGTTAAHTIALDIHPEVGAGSLRAVGGWDGAQWTGEIQSAVLDQELLGSWSLSEPARLSVSAESIAVSYACLQKAPAKLCLGGELGSGNESLELTIDSFDIAWLQPLITEPVTVGGLYDATVSLRGPLTRPTGRLNVHSESSLVRVSDVEAPFDIPLDDVSIDAELTQTRLEASAGFRTGGQTNVSISGAVTDIWTPAPQIDATVEGTWADVGILSLLSPDIGRVSGLASFSLAFSGSIEAPEVHGEADWTGGEIVVPRWGLVFDDVDVHVSSRTGRELTYAMSAVAGDGTINLTGETLLDPGAMWPTSFSVSGRNLPAVQLPEAQIVVSPDLEVVTAWPKVNVSGTVAVPSANLNRDELPGPSITTSPDVVVHGRTIEAPQRPLDVIANLHLVLGDDVRFTGSGMNARLSGEMDIDYRSGRDAVATGTLALAGEYMTFNQTLELDRGQLSFTGPVTNPALDVRAIKRFETSSGEVNVGVTVTGTLRQPVTRLYSDPSMSDGDVISYLVVGRPLSDSSRENTQALQTAALSMGITQALPQIQHFGEVIGLDELGIRTSEANTGELMAGKQISSRIYMRYTYGLINRVGGLLLRFRLTDNLSLETRTGDNKAMDLLYMIERE
jgi:translocation and assembly module TamB